MLGPTLELSSTLVCYAVESLLSTVVLTLPTNSLSKWQETTAANLRMPLQPQMEIATVQSGLRDQLLAPSLTSPKENATGLNSILKLGGSLLRTVPPTSSESPTCRRGARGATAANRTGEEAARKPKPQPQDAEEEAIAEEEEEEDSQSNLISSKTE